jgi:hypothetical protein
MDNTISIIEPLIEKAEKYSKTNLELLKLKVLDKTANMTSILLYQLLLAAILSIFAIILSLAIALWLGNLLGKNYYGFLIVASFYGVIGIITLSIQPFIKRRLNNWIIMQALN